MREHAVDPVGARRPGSPRAIEDLADDVVDVAVASVGDGDVGAVAVARLDVRTGSLDRGEDGRPARRGPHAPSEASLALEELDGQPARSERRSEDGVARDAPGQLGHVRLDVRAVVEAEGGRQAAHDRRAKGRGVCAGGVCAGGVSGGGVCGGGHDDPADPG